MPPLPPILFEDDHLLAFDKPSGLLVAPDRWNPDALNLAQMIREQMGPGIFNVHRLDRDTSGVILCAKNKAALDRLSGQFQARTVQKRYVAIALGSPLDDEMTVTVPVVEDARHPGRMRIDKHARQPASTRFRVLERWRGYSLIEAFPSTGRTHQIRVHLTFLGCPVLADPFYGDGQGLLLSSIKTGYKHKSGEDERPLLSRLALHAESLGLKHPVTGQPLSIHSPLPKSFNVAIKYLRRFVGL
jgi:RluA family pseudouridine synthase